MKKINIGNKKLNIGLLLVFISGAVLSFTISKQMPITKQQTQLAKHPPSILQTQTPTFTNLRSKSLQYYLEEPVAEINTTSLKQIVQNKQPKLDPALTQPIANAISKYSKEFNLPELLIISLIERESSFNPQAVSSANCIGLMQINPKAHTDKLKEQNINRNQLFHIDNNIHLGVRILSEYYKQTQSIEKALMKYVGGNQAGYVCDILASYTDLTISK